MNSTYQLLEIFPEAKFYVINKLNSNIKHQKELLKNAELLQIECQKITSKSQARNRWFFEMVAELVIIPDKEEIRGKIKKDTFLLSALKSPKKTEIKDDSITDHDIARAKEVPLVHFIEINRVGFARCPFHEDRHPSLKVYEKVNRWWCYSCNSGGDVIDFIMRQRGIEFIEAVKLLIKK